MLLCFPRFFVCLCLQYFPPTQCYFIVNVGVVGFVIAIVTSLDLNVDFYFHFLYTWTTKFSFTRGKYHFQSVSFSYYAFFPLSKSRVMECDFPPCFFRLKFNSNATYKCQHTLTHTPTHPLRLTHLILLLIRSHVCLSLRATMLWNKTLT